MINEKFLLVGIITDAHGINGEVKVRSYTQSPENIIQYKILYDKHGKFFKIKKFKKTSKDFIMKIEGVNDRTTAETFQGTKLFVDRDTLSESESEEDEFYHHELLELKVFDKDKKLLGFVKAFHNFGGGDIIEIEFSNKTTEFYIFSKQIIPEINLQEKYIILEPPEEI
ncbi:MAG: ribosome maturation factor RimM [Alphaproteobacteria bacterium]